MAIRIISFFSRNWLFWLVLLLVLVIGVFSFPKTFDQISSFVQFLSNQGVSFRNPEAPNEINKAVDNLQQNLTPLIISLGKLLAAVLAVPLGAVLLWRLARLTLFRPPDLIVENVGNASGYAELDKTLAGLGQLSREELVQYTKYVYERVRENREEEGQENREEEGQENREKEGQENREKDQNAKYYVVGRAQLPRATRDQRLNELTASLKDAAPSQVKPLLHVLPGVFLERGTRVTSNLQRRGDVPDRVGLTFEISDVTGKEVPEPRTIWEPPRSKADHIPQGDGCPPRDTKEDKEACYLYTLGRLYEERAAFEQAKARYEDALKKQPVYPEAESALRRVLEASQPPTDRYLQLLNPATYWLALQLSMREMVSAVPLRYWRGTALKHLLPEVLPLLRKVCSREDHQGWVRKKICEIRDSREDYQGWVHNFFGMQHLVSGARWFPAYAVFFYEQAIMELKRAVELTPDNYRPYENLADAYRFRGREAEGGVEYQIKAIRNYKEALEKAENKPLDERRIRVSKAIAQLLKGDTEESKGEIDSVQTGWEGASEESGRLLYNMGCWYALAYEERIGVAYAERKALRYLTYGLIRNPKNLDWIDHDPNLARLGKGISGHIAMLKDKVSAKLKMHPKLSKGETKNNQTFREIVTGIVNEVISD